uniref:Uncharacterized protein n=1 Tax=Sphenodon punctatus TaxID=8508 RepID=A0A8D0HLB0_SPHPU
MASLQLNVSSAEGNVTQQRNVVFVIDSNPFVFVSVQSKDLSLTFVYNLSRLYVSGPNTKSNTSLPVFSSSEGLLQWVKETYGGITSFTELKNPQWIRFQVGEDASSPSECIPKMDFNARSYLESEVSFQEVRSCKDPSMQERKEAHIVRVNQSLEETSPKSVEVELNVVCPGGEPVKEPAVLLILYSSQPDLSWKFCQMPGKIQFLASGKYSFQSMPPFVVNGTSLPDTKQGLISKAHEQGYNHIGSYTEVSSASRVTLQLHQCVSTERTRETTTLTSSHMPVSAIRHPVENVVLLCKPWRCMDDSIEIVLHKIFLQASRYSVISVTLQDPQCKAEQNETHFVLRSRLGSCDTDLEPWSKGFKAKNKVGGAPTQQSLT